MVEVGSTTCIEPWFSEANRGRMRFRYRVLEGNVSLAVGLRFGFAGDMGEPECLGPHSGLYMPLPQVALPSTEFATFDSGLLPFFWAPRGMVYIGLFLRSSATEASEILLDDIGFTFDGDAIFNGSFEDGAR